MKRNAFTLIELLVVIAIITIFASLAIPAFNAIRNHGGSHGHSMPASYPRPERQ